MGKSLKIKSIIKNYNVKFINDFNKEIINQYNNGNFIIVEKLKYAYIYLKNSQQMIVKKLEIDYFELSDPRKGYDDDDLQCFIINFI